MNNINPQNRTHLLLHLTTFPPRFYQVLLQALQEPDGCPLIQASILLSSRTLFCCNLRGINLLFPTFLSAVASVLLDRYCRSSIGQDTGYRSRSGLAQALVQVQFLWPNF